MQAGSTDLLPEIDLSLVTYNSSKWIADFFASLRAQHYPLNRLNVYVRDNGSTDATLRLLEDVRSRQDGYASFHIESGGNVGFGRGHNANLVKGEAGLFLVSNLDLIYEEDAILRIAAQALRDDEMIAGWEFRQKPFEHPKYYDPISLLTPWSSGACVLFRRKALEQVGGFEPRVFMYGEDADLSFRLRSAGHVLKYCPAAVCWHYSYESAQTIKPLQFIGSKLGVAYLRLRFGNWWQAAMVAPLYLAAMLMPQRFPRQRAGLARSFLRLLRDVPYFLVSRSKVSGGVPFRRFDCGPARPGAFYENRPMPAVCPLVTIIVLAYQGRQPLLRETIQTVLNQTYPNIELIVAGDGRSGAEEMVREMAQRGILAGARYVFHEEGKTAGAALTEATGGYVGVLDDRVLLFSDHVEVLVEELLASPDYAGAYGGTGRIDASTGAFAGACNFKTRVTADTLPSSGVEGARHGGDIAMRSALLFRKGLCDGLVGLDAWSIRLEGGEFLPVPKLTSLYRDPQRIPAEGGGP